MTHPEHGTEITSPTGLQPGTDTGGEVPVESLVEEVSIDGMCGVY